MLGERLQGISFVTGNTVIDALHLTAQRIDSNRQLRHALDRQFSFLVPERRVLVVTGHRRENFGDGFLNICKALGELARRDDIQIVYPVHLNPNVLGPVTEHLGDLPNVHLIKPLDYLSFVRLMQLPTPAACRKKRRRWASRCWSCAMSPSVPRQSPRVPYAWWAPRPTRSFVA
ncbi:UDP-N-acetylglucosamine 2-epimerase [Pseudomonas savastanoi pv. nerii]|nr:UDP-N-acetylglucosamine 2-epimerase [Pseudomonas savastanoi pv. nerii]